MGKRDFIIKYRKFDLNIPLDKASILMAIKIN